MRIRKINQSAGLVASVVDNLSTTSKVDALSANQGVILKNMIEQGGGGFSGDSLPIGSIIEYTSDIIPEGWLLCNGQAVSRSVYIDLFNLVGTDYGQGDGVTTFNVPDLRGKTLVGKSESDTDFNTLGKTGGEKTHILTVNEMPSHKHNEIKALNGTQTLYTGESVNTVGNQMGVRNNTGSTNSSYKEPLYTSDTGGNQSHNNMQPYMITNYIIKASKKGEIPKDAEVINNLESTSSTDALSANMGRILNKKFDYSTEEIQVGVFTDGKPIYRKIIVINSLSGDNLYAHNINNLDNLISIYGTMYMPTGSGNGWQPIPRINIAEMSSYGIEIGNVRETTFKLTRGSGYSSFGRAIVILEYTKTTD